MFVSQGEDNELSEHTDKLFVVPPSGGLETRNIANNRLREVNASCER